MCYEAQCGVTTALFTPAIGHTPSNPTGSCSSLSPTIWKHMYMSAKQTSMFKQITT